MRLEKWYADVADGGSVFISYSASLAIGPVALASRRRPQAVS
jgi:hypothetical protein